MDRNLNTKKSGDSIQETGQQQQQQDESRGGQKSMHDKQYGVGNERHTHEFRRSNIKKSDYEGASATTSYFLVSERQINLRNAMVDMSVPPNYKDSDPYQETQLLFQECVTIDDNSSSIHQSFRDDWVKIHAPHQLTFDFYQDGQLHPYPGFVHKSQLIPVDESVSCPMLFAKQRVIVAQNLVPIFDSSTGGQEIMKLSIGTTLEYIGNQVSRGIEWAVVRIYPSDYKQPVNALIEASQVQNVISSDTLSKIALPVKQAILVSTGNKLLGWPYAWGGRSSFDVTQVTQSFSGVDCSGFVSTVYWVGLSIKLPRNAHDQFRIARNITRQSTDDFSIGDLLFLGKLDPPHRIVHVMMYIGDGFLMESSETTRIMPVAQRVNVQHMSDLSYGQVIVDRGVQKRFYWGRILEDPQLTNKH